MSIQQDLELTERIRLATALINGRLQRTVAGASLTNTTTTILARAARGSEVRLSQLAAQLGLNPTMLSRVANRLEDSGLVARRSDIQDGRVVFIEATQKGRKLIARIMRERTQLMSPFVDALNSEERQILDAALPILERLAEHLKDVRP